MTMPAPHDPAARANTLPWPPMLYGIIALLAYGLETLAPSPAWPTGLPWREIGGLMFLVGIALVIWAIVTFKQAGTVVDPAGIAKYLALGGPYQFTRNPMYVAGVLCFLGAALRYGSLWTLVLVPVLALALDRLAIASEELHLEARFGEAYRAYKSRVRRWL